jgi:hypothetical protein
VTRRAVWVGVAAVALYVGVVALTAVLGPGHVRPLYDGFTGPPKYEWVDPPSFFASGNQSPGPVTSTIPIGRAGSHAAGVATPDGQFVINLGEGAVAPTGGAHAVGVRITPVAPKSLGALPGGLRANGNAYRVTMTAGSAPVRALDRPGTVVLEIPELGPNLFWSASGSRWTKLPARVLLPRQLGLTAEFRRPGYYVSGTDLPELVAAGAGSSSNALVVGIIVAVLAVLLVAGGYLLVRRRRNRSTGEVAAD